MRGAALYIADSERVALHATQAWKVAIAVEAGVAVDGPHGPLAARVIVVAPHAPQTMGGSGPIVTFFAEPGSHLAPHSGVQPPQFDPGPRTAEALARVAREVALGRADDDAEAAREVFALLGLAPRPVGDPRVEEALRRAAVDPDLDLAALAAARRISPSRLRHLVEAHTGLSLRTHRLWHRTLRAVEALLRGAPVARAAVEAGFADHAHFTRSFVRFFGRAPSTIRARSAVLASYASAR